MRRLLSLVLIAAGLAAPGRASAQNKAAADAVFKEGRRLLAKGDVTAACAKFEGSLKLMEQLGVRLNLADCYERLGKLSAAYAEFRTAEIAATRAGDRRAQFAGDRLAALEKRMPYLSVGLASGAAITGLVVERDGQPLDPSLLDTALPIDPGEHEVTARAPGRLPWSFRIEAVEGARSTVEVPLLQPEPRPAAPAQAGKPVAATRPVPPREEPMPTTIPPAPEPSDERKPGRTARAWGTLLTVAGAGALVTCLVFGSQAESRWSEAEASGHCDDSGSCDEVGYPMALDARSAAATSTAFFIVGSAALTAGIVLTVKGVRAGRAGEEAQARARLSPIVHPGGAGLALAGTF